MRNTLNGLLWIAGLSLYLVLIGTVHALLGESRLELDAALFVAPLSRGLPGLERLGPQRQADRAP